MIPLWRQWSSENSLWIKISGRSFANDQDDIRDAQETLVMPRKVLVMYSMVWVLLIIALVGGSSARLTAADRVRRQSLRSLAQNSSHQR
jgi:hypothetical protein